MDVHLLALAGLGTLVGMVMALTGAGGGALGVPLLVLVFGWSVQEASPVALVAVGLSALLGASLALRDGLVRWRAALLLGASGMLTAPLGVWLALRTPQRALLLVFSAFMVYTAWRMWRVQPLEAVRRDPACVRPVGALRLQWTRRCAWVMARVGATAGLLSGLLGIGGGFVIVPALDRESNLDLKTIQATSLAVIALVSSSGIGAALWHGHFEPGATLPFAVGTACGLVAGRSLASRLSAFVLRRAFAAVAVGVAGLLLLRGLKLPG